MMWVYIKRADALLFLGRIDEARAIFLQHRGAQHVNGTRSWEAAVVEEFSQLRAAGLTSPLMDEIEKLFSSAG
jgi:hypothetical protein